MELSGKTALVTGAAKRIGRRIALRLAENGVNVCFSYRHSRDESRRTLEELRSLGVRTCAIQADLTDIDQCDRLLLELGKTTGAIDILVNNASDFMRTPLEDLDRDQSLFLDTFKTLFKIHVRAPFYLSLRLGLRMKEQGWGRIINITDRAVARAQAYRNHSLYLASKYALFGVTQTLAVELAPEVLVNSVAPGFVIAPPHYSEAKTDRLLQKIPLQREAGSGEIAGDVLHLILAEFKTGSWIVSDGGEGVIS